MSKPTAEDMLGSFARRAQRRLNTALERMTVAELRAWMLAPFTVAGGFVVAGVGAAMLASAFGVWDLPVAGFAAALAVVLVAEVAAPSHKLAFSVLCFCVGAVVAWWALKGSYYPENHPTKAYLPTYWPLTATLFGGVIGVLAAIVRSLLLKRRPSAQAL